MDSTRLRECLEILHLSQRAFARAAQCNENSVQQWARGHNKVPERLADWLERAVEFYQKNPIPLPEKRQ